MSANSKNLIPAKGLGVFVYNTLMSLPRWQKMVAEKGAFYVLLAKSHSHIAERKSPVYMISLCLKDFDKLNLMREKDAGQKFRKRKKEKYFMSPGSLRTNTTLRIEILSSSRVLAN